MKAKGDRSKKVGGRRNKGPAAKASSAAAADAAAGSAAAQQAEATATGARHACDVAALLEQHADALLTGFTNRSGQPPVTFMLDEFPQLGPMPAINRIGQEGGYSFIFRKYESGLIYADEAGDITEQVIQRMDAESQ